jgi:cell division protein FtsX
MWIERVDQPSESEGKEYPLEASFIIRMPESEESVRVRERIRDEEGMEMLHGHLELGIWKGILRT